MYNKISQEGFDSFIGPVALFLRSLEKFWYINYVSNLKLQKDCVWAKI